MMNSDGHVISALEEHLGYEKPARSFWEKYFNCFKKSKLLDLITLIN